MNGKLNEVIQRVSATEAAHRASEGSSLTWITLIGAGSKVLVEKDASYIEGAVPNSFAEWMIAAGMDLVITQPEGYELDPRFTSGARIEYDQMKALEGADFVYAKNWSCPGVTDPAKYGQILCNDKSWTVDEAHMAVTDNAFFIHCLPVRRNVIVSDAVIDAPTSLVIPEAANREIAAQVVMKRMLESL